MKTHGPFITNIVLWLTMLSPLISLIVAFLSALLFSGTSG
jgi:hypothetical protein